MSGYQNTGNWTGAQVDALLNKADSSAQKDQNLSDLADVSVARTNLGLAIGSDVQGFDADTAKTDVVQTFTAKQTFTEYAETGATLSVADDGNSPPASYSVTVPMDGGVYAVTLTQDVDLILSDLPTPPVCGSAVVYITQDATAKAVSVPAGWYWPDGTAETFDENSALYRLTLYTDPAGNVHADAELRGVTS